MKRKRINHISDKKGLNLLGSNWTLIVPLHLEIPAKYYFMHHLQFFKQNISLFQALGNIVKFKGLDINRELYDKDTPSIGSSHGTDGEGMYIRISQYKNLSNEQHEIIKNLFPLSIEGYELKLHSTSDFDYDDDRMWCPSIQFGIYKDGQNILTS